MSNIVETDEIMIRCFQQWGWLDGLRARGPETLFVTDADIADQLSGLFGKNGPQITVAGKHDTVPLDGVTEVIFFCRDHERAYAQQTAKTHPTIAVASATYDYLPMGIVSGRFERLPTGSSAKKKVNLIMAAPAAGAEDLIGLLTTNKVCAPQKFMTHALAYWAAQTSGFSLMRYLNNVGACFDEQTIDLFIETDVLAVIVGKTGLPWEKLFAFIKTVPVNMLYFTRRAKIAQAVELAQNRGLPSAVFLDGQPAAHPQGAHIETFCVDAWIESLLRLEIEIEAAMEPVAKMKNITLEDLHGAPDNVLPDVGTFFRRGVRKKRDYSAVFAGIDAAKEFAPLVQQHSKRMIDYLGLRVSEQGSFISITQSKSHT